MGWCRSCWCWSRDSIGRMALWKIKLWPSGIIGRCEDHYTILLLWPHSHWILVQKSNSDNDIFGYTFTWTTDRQRKSLLMFFILYLRSHSHWIWHQIWNYFNQNRRWNYIVLTFILFLCKTQPAVAFSWSFLNPKLFFISAFLLKWSSKETNF